MKMLLCLCWLFIAIAHKAGAHLSDDFQECTQFFYKNHLPTGFQNIATPDHFNHRDLPDGIKLEELSTPAYICQKFNGNTYFASLYDRGRRLPLYSAYIMDQRSKHQLNIKRPSSFSIEPQLIYRAMRSDMNLEGATKQEIKIYNKNHKISEKPEKNRPSYLVPTSQAVDNDYENSGFQRGHVNPNGHHVNQADQDATFTLTNVVPMTPKLNNEIWNNYEKEMISYATGCTTMYVVTGIVPGNNWIKTDRVTIPSHVWNAYCCVDNNDNPIKSGAALRENNNLNTPVVKMSILELQAQLKNLPPFSGDITIFQNNCIKTKGK